MLSELLARDVPVTCTACGWQFTVERTSAGMACNCPECGELLDVPANARGGLWKPMALFATLLIAGGIGWTVFFGATDATPVAEPEVKKSTAKTAAPVFPQIDEIPFVSESKSLPGKLPDVVDFTPPADPYVTPSLETLVAQATTKSPEDKPDEKGIPKPPRPSSEPANVTLDEAVAAFRRNDLAKTNEILKEARLRFPELPPQGFMLGELYLTHNNLAAGRAELEKVAADDPKYPGTYMMFGNLAMGDGRVTEAQLLFAQAESLEDEIKDPERRKTLQTNIRSGQVSVFEARKDWPAVIKTANAWLLIDPKSGRARQRMARAYLAKGDVKEATQQLEAARGDDKTLVIPDIALATFYTEFADFKSAEECLLRAAKANPKDARIQQAVANWLLSQDRAQDAHPFIVESLKIDPTSTESRYIAGMIARQLRDYKTAESSFETVLRDAPANFLASNQLALILADQDDEVKRRRAIEMAEVNARQYPRNADASATLGWVYYRAGKLEQAEQALQAAISGGKATSDMAYYLAHVMADRNRIDDAARLLQGALRAPGTFTFRKEAQAWLDRLTSKPKK